MISPYNAHSFPINERWTIWLTWEIKLMVEKHGLLKAHAKLTWMSWNEHDVVNVIFWKTFPSGWDQERHFGLCVCISEGMTARPEWAGYVKTMGGNERVRHTWRGKYAAHMGGHCQHWPHLNTATQIICTYSVALAVCCQVTKWPMRVRALPFQMEMIMIMKALELKTIFLLYISLWNFNSDCHTICSVVKKYMTFSHKTNNIKKNFKFSLIFLQIFAFEACQHSCHWWK